MIVKDLKRTEGEVGMVRDAFYDSERDKDSANSRSCEFLCSSIETHA
jgi:hypothetical protein